MPENTAIYWIRYGYAIKDPAVKPVAEDFETGETVTVEKGELLAYLMNEIDKKEGKGQWVSDETSTDWNFAGCYVEHRGKNDPSYPTKGTMKNVLILRFPEGATGPFGRFYIPYNDGV